MGLSNKKEDEIKHMPKIENKAFLSKTGKYFVHQTVITWARPVEYIDAIMKGEEQTQEESFIEPILA